MSCDVALIVGFWFVSRSLFGDDCAVLAGAESIVVS